jgi:hypothetical protein
MMEEYTLQHDVVVHNGQIDMIYKEHEVPGG